MRVTPQRLAIWRILAESRRHLTAEEIARRVQKRFPSLSLNTVYTSLERLVQEGEVNKLRSHSVSALYEIADQPHDHFYCLSCGVIIDIHEGTNRKLQLPRALRKKLSVKRAQISFHGYCEKCQSINKQKINSRRRNNVKQSNRKRT